MRFARESLTLPFVAVVIATLVACSDKEPGAAAPPGEAGVFDTAVADGGCTPSADPVTPYEDLAQYCVVELVDGEVRPRAGVTPYDLNTPLFSDYAVKRRTVWIPPGTTVTAKADDVFDFPIGSIVTKSFGFPDDARKAAPKLTWIETRIMMRGPSGWRAFSYVWDAAQTRATLKVEGEVRPISFVHGSGETLTASYLVPNANQCKKCHDRGGEVSLIGPTAENLARSFAYSTGSEPQLAHWQRVGLLASAPTPAPLPTWDDPSSGTTAQRARAWLDVNCAHCHRADGAASTTGLDLRYAETNPYRLGACKTPIAAGKASADMKYDVVPGDPDHSILVYRMAATEPAIAMPEIGRSLVAREPLALVRQWIAEMSGGCGGDAGTAD